MLLHYIKLSLRFIKKSFPQYMVGIMGVSFAVSCLVLSLYWVDFESSFDGFYPDADCIYRIYTYEKDSGKTNTGASKTVERKLCGKYSNIEASTTLMRGDENCSTPEIPHMKLRFLYADSSFFNVFSHSVIVGDKEPLSSVNNLVLTESAAVRLFGSVDNAIGQYVQSNMRDDLPPYHVTAVVQDHPSNTNLPYDGLVYHNMLKSFSEMPEQVQWSINFMEVYVKFNRSADIDKIKDEICCMASESNVSQNVEIRMVNIMDVRHSLEDNSPFNMNFIRLFVFSAILLLISSLFNYFNIHYSLIKQRLSEFKLRSINGAKYSQLVSQLLVELLITMTIAFCLSLFLLFLISPYFKNLLEIKDSTSDLLKLSFCCFLAVAFAVFAIGLVLFLHFIKESLSITMIQSDHSAKFRKMAVSIQLFSSITFIVIALIMMRQMDFLIHKDLGFESKGLIRLSGFVDYSGAVEEKLVERINSIPSVLSISDANFEPKHQPDLTYMTNDVKWPGAPIERPLFSVLFADDQFSDAFNLTVLQGNWWNKGQFSKAVLNEEAVRRMNLIDPVGTIIQLPSESDRSVLADYEIVGVVKDFHTLSFRNAIAPMIIIPSAFYKFNILYIRTMDGSEADVINQIRDAAVGVDPSLIDISLTPVGELFDRLNYSEHIGLKIFSWLAFVCLVISLLGTYAIVLSSTQRRSREIAIRKVLGADIRSVVWLFLKEYIALVVITGLLALPVAYFIMERWLQDFAYHTSIPLGLLLSVLLAVTLLVTIVALRQIIRMSTRNPAIVIKKD